MVSVAEWFRRNTVDVVYVGSNPTTHPKYTSCEASKSRGELIIIFKKYRLIFLYYNKVVKSWCKSWYLTMRV